MTDNRVAIKPVQPGGDPTSEPCFGQVRFFIALGDFHHLRRAFRSSWCGGRKGVDGLARNLIDPEPAIRVRLLDTAPDSPIATRARKQLRFGDP